MTHTELIGWIGSVCFATCAIPQAWQSIKQKHSRGLSWAFLVAWFIGEIFTIWYIILTNPTPILLLNYGVNFLVLLIILRYKIWEGVKNDSM
jgi:uncharacterized protein with PQ loop repeat